MLGRLFGKKKKTESSSAVYAAIVAASRQRAFYAEFGIADTLEGRFEVLVLHGALALHRFSAGGEVAASAGQEVFDLMFSDLDQSLRELGVGDMAVPKRIRRMAEAFYGRAHAYRAALEVDAPDGALELIIERNMFGGDSGAPQDGVVAGLAGYVRAAAAAFAETSDEALLGADLPFPDAAQFLNEGASIS